MGIDCRIQHEDGEVLKQLNDPKSWVANLLQLTSIAVRNSVCLRFIDEYGDTTFNQLQIPVLLKELQDILPHCDDAESRAHAQALIAFVSKANGETHTYLKFIGD